ncbi:MAG: ferritin-like domain-containing protein [Gammaproteobacteria bacterium]|nr:ferritin-like domain-containing protein [Gammaproteobacteria bacterium]
MKNLFEMAEACLQSAEVAEKLALSHQAKALMTSGSLDFSSNTPVQPISAVRFPARPVLMSPRHMPNRGLGTHEGVIAFFHAIAHVEFMAISLAWDLLYRFRGLPVQFYQDWLTIADEEAQHFELIQQHLQRMNVNYGDLPAHGGLWDHAVETADHLLARLAMVPRCMEARGLDVTPGIINKFAAMGDQAAVAILNRILTDEITHVERGSYWFNTLCRQQDIDPDSHYQQLIKQYYRGGKPKGPFNRELRAIAGFSEVEMNWLEAH